jgi:hypothetical protein
MMSLVGSRARKPGIERVARFVTGSSSVVRTTRREVTYRWSAPRSPAVRLLLAPLFFVALLLLVMLGVVVLALTLVLSFVGLIALVAAGLFSARARGTRRATVQVIRRRP